MPYGGGNAEQLKHYRVRWVDQFSYISIIVYVNGNETYSISQCETNTEIFCDRGKLTFAFKYSSKLLREESVSLNCKIVLSAPEYPLLKRPYCLLFSSREAIFPNKPSFTWLQQTLWYVHCTCSAPSQISYVNVLVQRSGRKHSK